MAPEACPSCGAPRSAPAQHACAPRPAPSFGAPLPRSTPGYPFA